MLSQRLSSAAALTPPGSAPHCIVSATPVERIFFGWKSIGIVPCVLKDAGEELRAASATELDVVVARERLQQSIDVKAEDVDVVEHAWGGGGSDGGGATCGQSVIGVAKRVSVNS